MFVLWEFCVVSLFGVTFDISLPAENKGFGRNDAEMHFEGIKFVFSSPFNPFAPSNTTWRHRNGLWFC